MGSKNTCHHACQWINVQCLLAPICMLLLQQDWGSTLYLHGTLHPHGARCAFLLANPQKSSISRHNYLLKGGRLAKCMECAGHMHGYARALRVGVCIIHHQKCNQPEVACQVQCTRARQNTRCVGICGHEEMEEQSPNPSNK